MTARTGKKKNCYKKYDIACAVCGNASTFKYYGAQTCDSCKQFFRRAIVEQKIFYCLNQKKCDVKNDNRCRSCRLDQCLLAGMDPTMVIVRDTSFWLRFFKKLAKQRSRLMAERNLDTKEPLWVRQMLEGRKCTIGIGSEKEQKDTKDITVMEQFVKNENRQQQQQQCQMDTTSSCNLSVPTSMIRALVNEDPLEKFSNFCEIPLIRHQFGEKSIEASLLISDLVHFESKVELFYKGERQFPMDFGDEYDSMESLLNANFSGVVQHPDEFPICESAKNYSRFTKGSVLMMDLYTTIDIIRSIPVFSMLHLQDQVRLVNFIGCPLGSFRSKYHSADHHSEVEVKLPGGVKPLRHFQTVPMYQNDVVVQHLADHLFRRLLEPFNRVRLTKVEYLLLRAILICHPGTPGLSKLAQKMLQFESERYARILLHFLQAQHNDVAGGRRYAEVLALVECVLRAADRVHEFLTYLAMVTEQSVFHLAMPKAFMVMSLHGAE